MLAGCSEWLHWKRRENAGEGGEDGVLPVGVGKQGSDTHEQTKNRPARS